MSSPTTRVGLIDGAPAPSADGEEAALLEAARRGDHQAFGCLAEPHRRRLMLHCYRLLGSLHEAEDLVQESLLRAWRRLGAFEGRASFRSWLYTIATNACLDALDGRARRVLVPTGGPAAGPPMGGAPGAQLVPAEGIAWLEPYPDTLLSVPEDAGLGPAARYEAREGVELAFIAAIQYLAPRQRAVLLLRDVLGWTAAEVAALLETTVPAVNSALQRARTTLRRRFPPGAPPGHREEYHPQHLDGRGRVLLERYVRAWEAADLVALVTLLRADATLVMPPVAEWYQGRAAIGAFLAWVFRHSGLGPFRLVPTGANRQPAFALYGRDAGRPGYRGLAVQVLTLEGDSVTGIVGFVSPALLSRFGLPATLPA